MTKPHPPPRLKAWKTGSVPRFPRSETQFSQRRCPRVSHSPRAQPTTVLQAPTFESYLDSRSGCNAVVSFCSFNCPNSRPWFAPLPHFRKRIQERLSPRTGRQRERPMGGEGQEGRSVILARRWSFVTAPRVGAGCDPLVRPHVRGRLAASDSGSQTQPQIGRAHV